MTSLQLALSPTNPNHKKIMEYLEKNQGKPHGWRSYLVEQGVLMFIQSAVKPLPSGRGYKALDR